MSVVIGILAATAGGVIIGLNYMHIPLWGWGVILSLWGPSLVLQSRLNKLTR